MDTSFLTLKRVHPNLKSNVLLEFRFNLSQCFLDFKSFTEKPVFECAFAHPIMFFLLYLVKKLYGSCLCDMQISYEIVSNAHVRHLTVSLYSGSMFDEKKI